MSRKLSHKSVARKLSREIDQDAKTSWLGIWKGNAVHSDEMCGEVNAP